MNYSFHNFSSTWESACCFVFSYSACTISNTFPPLIIKVFTGDLIQRSIIAIKLPFHIIHISYENLTMYYLPIMRKKQDVGYVVSHEFPGEIILRNVNPIKTEKHAGCDRLQALVERPPKRDPPFQGRATGVLSQASASSAQNQNIKMASFAFKQNGDLFLQHSDHIWQKQAKQQEKPLKSTSPLDTEPRRAPAN